MFNSPRLDEIEQNPLYNLIINGGFDVWQRNTSFTGADVSFDYTADRFLYQESIIGGGNVTVSRIEDAPNINSRYSYNIECTTNYNVGGVNDLSRFRTIVEGTFASKLSGKKATLGFWVKASKTGNMTASLFTFPDSGVFDNVYQHQFTIDQANTWEFKVINIDTVPSSISKSVGRGFEISLSLNTGTNFHTTMPFDTWTSAGAEGSPSDPLGKSNDTDWMLTTGDYVRFTQFQLYSGEVDLGEGNRFQTSGRNFAEELQLCQRYYEKSHALGIFPGQSSSGFESIRGIVGAPYFKVAWKVQKRGTPWARVYDLAGNADRIRVNATENVTLNGTISPTNAGMNITHNTSANEMFFHWTADAEL